MPRYWHLLSLDAPTVAALWAWGLARALHVSLSASPLLLLFTGTWLLYVADRVLDGFRAKRGTDADSLRERHYFYIRHRAAALLASMPAAALLVWLVIARMLPAARRADVLIFAVAAAYFLIVHLRGPETRRWFPKELIVALVFAAGTAVPAWTRLVSAESGAVIALLASLFAALCWLNCIAIEKWEQEARIAAAPALEAGSHKSRTQAPSSSRSAQRVCRDGKSDPIARWGQRRLGAICLGIAVVALTAAALLLSSGQLPAAALCLAAALSSGLFVALDRRPLPAFQLRIAADAALLTPLLLVFFR